MDGCPGPRSVAAGGQADTRLRCSEDKDESPGLETVGGLVAATAPWDHTPSMHSCHGTGRAPLPADPVPPAPALPGPETLRALLGTRTPAWVPVTPFWQAQGRGQARQVRVQALADPHLSQGPRPSHTRGTLSREGAREQLPSPQVLPSAGSNPTPSQELPRVGAQRPVLLPYPLTTTLVAGAGAGERPPPSCPRGIRKSLGAAGCGGPRGPKS